MSQASHSAITVITHLRSHVCSMGWRFGREAASERCDLSRPMVDGFNGVDCGFGPLWAMAAELSCLLQVVPQMSAAIVGEIGNF